MSLGVLNEPARLLTGPVIQRSGGKEVPDIAVKHRSHRYDRHYSDDHGNGPPGCLVHYTPTGGQLKDLAGPYHDHEAPRVPAGLSGRSASRSALRLSKAFGSSAEVWLGMQMEYDLAQANKNAGRIKVHRVTTSHTAA
jgi:hypothetical protein